MRHFIWLSLVLLLSCKKKEETIQPTVRNITESVYASGVIKSKNQYQVYSSVNGLIQKVHVTEGDEVKKGDPIITLTNDASRLTTDNARLAAEYSSIQNNADKLNEIKVSIDLARAKMQNDSLLLQRQRELWAQDIGSRNELEQKELAYKNAISSYKSAVLRYNQMKTQVNYSSKQAQKNLQISNVQTGDFIIRSRFNGRIYNIMKEEGEMVNTQTPVAIIGDASDFLLELQVDEYDIGKIKPGQKVLLSLDSYKQQVLEAFVTRIDPIMNDRSRSFKIEATFAAIPVTLYPNLSAEANIIITTKENTLTIPRTYLVNDNEVILQSGEKRKVSIGLKDLQVVEIISGITKEDVLKKPVE